MTLSSTTTLRRGRRLVPVSPGPESAGEAADSPDDVPHQKQKSVFGGNAEVLPVDGDLTSKADVREVRVPTGGRASRVDPVTGAAGLTMM